MTQENTQNRLNVFLATFPHWLSVKNLAWVYLEILQKVNYWVSDVWWNQMLCKLLRMSSGSSSTIPTVTQTFVRPLLTIRSFFLRFQMHLLVSQEKADVVLVDGVLGGRGCAPPEQLSKTPMCQNTHVELSHGNVKDLLKPLFLTLEPPDYVN